MRFTGDQKTALTGESLYTKINRKVICKLNYLCSRSGRKIGRPRGFQRHFAIAGIGYSVPYRRPIVEKMEISIYHFCIIFKNLVVYKFICMRPKQIRPIQKNNKAFPKLN